MLPRRLKISPRADRSKVLSHCPSEVKTGSLRPSCRALMDLLMLHSSLNISVGTSAVALILNQCPTEGKTGTPRPPSRAVLDHRGLLSS